MGRSVLLYLLLVIVGLSFAPRVAAFGAGNIPSYAYLEDKAFRHGDIEDVIATLFKAAGGGFLSRGTKFTPLDVKRVYFGNWLRDYSQAVDVGALKKVPLQTIMNICMVLGFLAHGYATGEFEVTEERLGAYLPTEHIDNPKGYAEGEDARQYDRRLRPPVEAVELEIDLQSGMKRYIADESGHWDTSKALVRRTLVECINMGRQYRQSGDKAHAYQAFQLLGRALHTLEDFTAHSNFCELVLISMGHNNIFPHVGQNVKIKAPNGKMVYPLVTGTFGGADFIHSLLGEATDHLSEASVSDLTKTMKNARSVSEGNSASASALRSMFLDLPGGAGDSLSRDMDGITGMRAGQPGGLDPSQMSPQELHATLWKILSFRDSVMKRIENTIDRIPGLASLVEKLTNSISVFIITTLEPFVKPLLGSATSALSSSSQAVIDSHDQYEVWNDWNSSDPTHSFLSKDHFALILNQPAGEIAKVVVEYAVNLVVKAWDDPGMSTQQVTEPILECLFHPDFHDGRSQVQRMMLDKMKHWFQSTGRDQHEILNRLTSENVRAGKNKRIGDNSTDTGHVHNSMLPEGGLQQVLAQHNVHIPGAQILNAGQDLLGGKKPWDQGFGSGGQHAWRDINSSAPNDIPPSLAPYEQGPSHPGNPGNYSQPSPSGGHADSYYQGGNQGGYQPPQQQSYGPPGGAYGGPPGQYGGYGGPPQGGQYGDPQGQYSPQGQYGPPQGQYAPQGQYGGPPQNQYGGPPPGQYAPPQDQWGPPGQGYGPGGYNRY
ncbi:putative heterokaryon incompatibility protein HET-C [Kockovaella imperatae]|uniref:Putative heterokaryon incompatibility protein HET-C n=1 Tax=Kockovaella imperatae TaxID=4999 RepID=A0A1Y1UNV8_9TREE|nr:putative heterokaryon incompatibility protein HET-C [Kockovaella imperatae]ORX39730.1 putative heterokaryon incompatibility protein HET-C [Kockovaella imperatae]